MSCFEIRNKNRYRISGKLTLNQNKDEGSIKKIFFNFERIVY